MFKNFFFARNQNSKKKKKICRVILVIKTIKKTCNKLSPIIIVIGKSISSNIKIIVIKSSNIKSYMNRKVLQVIIIIFTLVTLALPVVAIPLGKDITPTGRIRKIKDTAVEKDNIYTLLVKRMDKDSRKFPTKNISLKLDDNVELWCFPSVNEVLADLPPLSFREKLRLKKYIKKLGTNSQEMYERLFRPIGIEEITLMITHESAIGIISQIKNQK